MNLRSEAQVWTLLNAFAAIYVYVALQGRYGGGASGFIILQNDSVSTTLSTSSSKD